MNSKLYWVELDRSRPSLRHLWRGDADRALSGSAVLPTLLLLFASALYLPFSVGPSVPPTPSARLRLGLVTTGCSAAGASGPAGPDAPAAEHPVVTKPSRSLAEGVGGTDGPTENGRYSAEANKRSRVGRTADPDRARSASPRHRCRREGRLRSSSTQYSLEFIGRRRPDVRMMAHDGRPPQAVRHAGGDDRSGERSDPPRSRRAVSRRSTRPRNVRTGRCCRMSKSRGPYGPGSLSSSLIQEDLCCRAGCRR